MALCSSCCVDEPPQLLCVPQVLASSSGKDFQYNRPFVNISSITWLTNVCGQVSVADVPAFRARWLNAFNAQPDSSTTQTLQNYYASCSYGRVRTHCGAVPLPKELHTTIDDDSDHL
jgi:hypothetical protein